MAYRATFANERPPIPNLPDILRTNPPVPGVGGAPRLPGGEGSEPPPRPPAPQQPAQPCPDGTPAGPAPCCPGNQVWRPDTKTCEDEDARSKAGKDTCVGPKPAGCHPDATWCDFSTAQWRCDPSANAKFGGGGGAAAGGGGGGGASQPKLVPDPAGGQAQVVWEALMQRLAGGSRYTPEVMASLLGETKQTAEAQANRQTEESNADLARRGLSRSTIAAEGQRQIRANVYAQVLARRNEILRAKIDADYQDKSETLNEMMNWVNSLRDFTARQFSTQSSRDVGMANVNLGYAQIQQQMNMLRERYAQQLSLLQLGGFF